MKFKQLLYAIIFFLPFAYVLVLDLKVPVKIYELLFVVFLSLWFMRSAKKGEVKFKIEKDYTPMILFVLWVIFGAIVAYFNLTSLTSLPDWRPDRGSFWINPIVEIAYYIFNIVLAIVVTNEIASKDDLKKIINIIVGASALVCLYGLYLFVGQNLNLSLFTLPTMEGARTSFGFAMPRIASTFKEPTFFAGYLAVVMPLTWAIYFGLKSSKSPRGILLLLLILLQLVSMALSFSTAGFISLFVAGIFFFGLYLRYNKKKALKTIIYLFVILSIGYWTIVQFNLHDLFGQITMGKLFSSDVNPVTWSRIERWQQFSGALTLFSMHPIMGIGISNYGLYFDNILNIHYGFEATANNVFVERLAETGTIGFILFIWFFVALFKKLFTAYKKIGSLEDPMLLIGIWSSLVALFTCWNFYPSESLSFFWVIFGLSIGYLNILRAASAVGKT